MRRRNRDPDDAPCVYPSLKNFSFEKWCRQPGTRINDIFSMIEKGKGWRAIRNRYPDFTKMDYAVYEMALREGKKKG